MQDLLFLIFRMGNGPASLSSGDDAEDGTGQVQGSWADRRHARAGHRSHKIQTRVRGNRRPALHGPTELINSA